MTFQHHARRGTYVRERREVLISVIADRREGPILRISVSAALADSLGWAAGERLNAGAGSCSDAGWLELVPAASGTVLRRAARGSRMVWLAKGIAGVPERHTVAAALYTRAASNGPALRVLLPWWQTLRVAA